MDLVRGDESKYEEYERLLLWRDQLNKEADQIWIVYLQLFGRLMVENFEEKIACIQCKKTIAYCQNALNRGNAVDADALKAFLDLEMAEYNDRLKGMIRDNEIADKAVPLSAYEVKRSKELYRRLVKLVHPDLNPALEESEELQELWKRILIAYRHSDVKELSKLEVLVRKVLKDSGLEDVKADIPDIQERIDDVKEEIEDIRNSEPYSLKSLIEDEEAVQRRTEEILKETEAFKKYRKELNVVIMNMISGGGLQIHVEGTD